MYVSSVYNTYVHVSDSIIWFSLETRPIILLAWYKFHAHAVWVIRITTYTVITCITTQSFVQYLQLHCSSCASFSRCQVQSVV